MTISESDLSNITDRYETSTITFRVTALLFESNHRFTITNRYTVSFGAKSDTGTFEGKNVSGTDISMPNNSLFVTIAVPRQNLTATQKLEVNWVDTETQEHKTDEFDLVVNLIS